MDSLAKYNIKNNARIEAYTVQEGDIIISNRGMMTKVCIIPEHNEKVLLSQNFIGIRLNGNISSEYVKEFLKSPLGQIPISSKQVETSIITLNSKDLKQIPIILVPLEKQLAIIKDYKEQEVKLKSEIDKFQDKLKEIKLNLYDDMGIGESLIVTK